jgi:TP901 family phage tail tape measure protein
MSANNVRAGGAFVEIFARTNALQVGLARAQAMTAGFAASSQRQLHHFHNALFQPVTARMAMLPATVTGLGMAGGGLSATLVLPLAAAGNEAIEFEKRMAGVSTMLSDKSFLPKFREQLLSLSKSMGEGTSNLAKSLQELLGSAIAPADAMGVLDVTTRMARAGMVDSATATLTMANNLNAFQIAATDAEDVADTLFTIVRNGVVTFEELTKHFGESSATAHAAGISLQEAGAAFATMTRNGLKADLAVTALNGIMAEFLKPSKDGKEAAAEFGLELSTTALRSKGLLTVMQELAALPEDVLARMFPDVRGLRGVLAIRGDLKGFVADMGSMAKRGGAMQEAFGIVSNTGDFKLGQATASLKDLAIAVGDAVLPLLTPLADLFRVSAHGVKDWVGANPQLIQQLAMLGGGLGVLSIGLVGLGLTATIMGSGLTAILGPLSLLVSGVGLATAALLAIPSLGIFTPLLAAVLTSLAYFGYFDEQVEATGDFFARTFAAIGDWFGRWGASLATTMEETWGGMQTAISRGDLQTAFELGTAGMEAAWTDALSRMTDVWHDWAGGLGDTFESLKSEIALLVVDAEGLWNGMVAAASGKHDSPEAAAGEVTSGLAALDHFNDESRKAEALREFDAEQVRRIAKKNGRLFPEMGEGWLVDQAEYTRERHRKGSPVGRERAALEQSMDDENAARAQARVANQDPGGADGTAERKRLIAEERDQMLQERQEARRKEGEAKRRDAAIAEANRKYLLAMEQLGAKAAADRRATEKGSGERAVRAAGPFAPARPDLPLPSDLSQKDKLASTGSFSVASLRGQAVGQNNPSVAAARQRDRMIRVLERIEKSSIKRANRLKGKTLEGDDRLAFT